MSSTGKARRCGGVTLVLDVGARRCQVGTFFPRPSSPSDHQSVPLMEQIVIIHDVNVVHRITRGTSAAPVAERRQLRQPLKERRTVALWRELLVGRCDEPHALLAPGCGKRRTGDLLPGAVCGGASSMGPVRHWSVSGARPCYIDELCSADTVTA